MANYAIQRRRGTAVEHASFTGLAGELTVNTTRNSVHVHDNSAAGGHELAKIDLSNVASTSIGAHILPSANVTYNLGSASKMWGDVFIGPSTLYINGIAWAGVEAGDIVMSGDTNENIILKALGSGDVELTPANGSIGLKGNVVLTNGKAFSSTGSEIDFNNDIQLNSNDILGVGTGNIGASSAMPRSYADSRYAMLTGAQNIAGNKTFDNNVIVSGDLTVSGTTTTVNTESLLLADNLITLNSNETGAPSENAGITINRGTSADVSFRWNETSDTWELTLDGTTYFHNYSANDAATANTANKLVLRDGSGNFAAGTITALATSAQYADLAERYSADAHYDAGTVVCFGGDNEITMSAEGYDHKVAGVISSAPAYMMNAEAGDDATHPFVALSGRVPCKVTGTVRKGDLLCTSDMAGHAMAGEAKCGHMIGKALEDFDGETGVIEVFVNLM